MGPQTVETKTFTPVKNTIRAMRRTRRAYFGLHVTAFEQAQIGFAKARELTDGLFEELVARGEVLETKAGLTLKDTQAKFLESYNETSETVRDLMPSSKARVEDLEFELETLKAKLKSITKAPAKKKATTQKTVAKKTTAPKKMTKKAASKPAAEKPVVANTAAQETITAQATAPKAAAKKPATAQASTLKADTQKVAEKVAPLKTEAAVADKYVSYIEDIRGYDKDVDAAIVKKVVDHCGIALQSRDGLFVACSDETERQAVRESWLVKKLGLTGEASELDAKVMTVCETMQKDRMKSRVTFYYLLAKNEGKLGAL